jgi:hypothetical protein
MKEMGGACGTYEGVDSCREGFCEKRPLGRIRCRLTNNINVILPSDGFDALVVSILATGTRVHGFKPGLSMPSFGGEVK